MNLNLTLLGEMLTFIVFVWFTMRFVWPPLTKALDERREKIAAGLAASDAAQRELTLAQHKITQMMTEAKAQIAQLIEQANTRANHIVEEAKGRARVEGERLIEIAKNDIEREVYAAKQSLMNDLASLVVKGAEKVVQHDVNKSANDQIIAEMVKEHG